MEEFRPIRSNNKARNLIFIFIIAAVAISAICAFFKEMPLLWLFQLIAFGLFTAGVFLVTRYLTKYYSYCIDGNDLTVMQLSRRQQLCVCRISLANVKSISLIDYSTGENIALAESLKKKRSKRFDYRVDLSPDKFIVIETDEGYENSTIYLSYEEKLLLSLSYFF